MKNISKKTSSVPMRGMRDLLPVEVSLRQAVIARIKEVYISYGFLEIETPVVERIDLLNTGEGGDNEKQTFAIMKRGMQLEDVKNASSLNEMVDGGLRFDLTVPLARYYANNQAQLPMPFKVLQIGSVFRAERPQKGRYRQFTQCDIDIIGDESGLAERELVLATSEALLQIGFSGFTVRINDRRILKGIAESCGYKEDEFEMVFIIIDKLDKIGLDGVEKELTEKSERQEASLMLMNFLRKVSGNINSTDLFKLLPKEVDETVIDELKQIMTSVETQSADEYQIVFDPTLVRGMGYYTGPIFEIQDKDFPSSIAGGGRYDKMIGKYSGKDIPACGFSIGFERIMSILEQRESPLVRGSNKLAVIYDPKNVNVDFALGFAKRSRTTDNIVIVQKRKKNMKKQLDDLIAFGYSSYCLLDSELKEPEFRPME